MANGSVEESQDYLRRCVNLHLIDRKTFSSLSNLSVTVSRMILSLIDYYERSGDEKRSDSDEEPTYTAVDTPFSTRPSRPALLDAPLHATSLASGWGSSPHAG